MWGADPGFANSRGNTARLRDFVGWVEALRNPTKTANVGFRSSTQPTYLRSPSLTEQY
jgi:hypothetical protein